MRRLPIPPRPPRSRIMRDYFGALIAIRRPGTALAQRAVELINFDRRAESEPEAGQMFRR